MNRQTPRSKAYLATRRGTYIARGSLNAPSTQSRSTSPVHQDKPGSGQIAHKSRSKTKDLPFKKRQSRSKVLSRSSISKKGIKRSLTFRRTASHALVSLFVVSNIMLGGYFVADKFYNFSPDNSVNTVKDSNEVLSRSTAPLLDTTNFPVAISESQTEAISAVQARGTDKKSNLLYPEDDKYVAWYESSENSIENANSASLLFTKLDIRNNYNNSFASASKNLEKGAQVTLSIMNGNVLVYEVVKKSTVDHSKIPVASLLKSESENKTGLNILVTTYDENKVYDTIIYCVQAKHNVY